MILAWKFLGADHKLNYRDGRVLVAGETLREPRNVNGNVVAEPILCRQGFHASVLARDALCYAPGPHIARVEIGGAVVAGDDKLAGTEIRCLWIADATKALRLFAVRRRKAQMIRRLQGREPSLAALWAIDCAERFVLGGADEDERQAAADAAAAAAAADAAYTYAADAAAAAAAVAAAAAASAYAAAAAAAADDDADAAYAATAYAYAYAANDAAYAIADDTAADLIESLESLEPK